jgi:IS6 family transposase
VHRQVKYLNNVIEADHGKLKQLIRPVRGFKTLKTASATIAGFEVMRALRKGQAAIFNLRATSEARRASSNERSASAPLRLPRP